MGFSAYKSLRFEVKGLGSKFLKGGYYKPIAHTPRLAGRGAHEYVMACS